MISIDSSFLETAQNIPTIRIAHSYQHSRCKHPTHHTTSLGLYIMTTSTRKVTREELHTIVHPIVLAQHQTGTMLAHYRKNTFRKIYVLRVISRYHSHGPKPALKQRMIQEKKTVPLFLAQDRNTRNTIIVNTNLCELDRNDTRRA